MDIKKIKGVDNFLYDSIDEFKVFNPGEKVIGNWRKGTTGDWVYTDDMYILQII